MQFRRLPPALALAAALLVAGPTAGSPAPAPATTAVSKATSPPAAAKPAGVPQRVDINSASLKQLKTLPGIGDAEARRIVAARPYPSKAKLVADNVIPYETFVAIKDMIVAVQKVPPPKGQPAGPAAAKPGDKAADKADAKAAPKS